MSKKTVLITGASRGIGLGLAKYYISKGWNVIGTYRNDPKEFAKLKEAKQVDMDVSSRDSIQAAFKTIRTHCDSIDLLINNAGQSGSPTSKLSMIETENMISLFKVNSLGPMFVTQAAVDLLEKGTNAKIVHISSKMGSIADNKSGGSYGYRASKTALNMMNQSLAIELKPKKIVSVVMHPGWVQTDMGGKEAPTTVDESVNAMTQTIERFTMEHTGGFFERTGERIPF